VEFGEGVHNTLGVDHHFQRIVGQAEQMVRLDQLQRLVGESGAVHGDLIAHAPGWMLEGFLHGGVPHSLWLPFAKRPTRGRQNETGQPAVASGDALKHGAVLGVDRHDLATAGARRLRYEVARHDQRLLVGQSHPLAGPERGQRGIEPGGAYHGVHHDIGIRMSGGLDQYSRTAGPSHIVRHAGQTRVAWAPLCHLRSELLPVPARS
jgi:hypothetical protein